jgi:hypothetical protein
MKQFQQDFKKIYKLLKSRTHISVGKFSDGEVYQMLGKKVILGDNIVQVGETKQPGGYKDPADHKNFDPSIHKVQRQLLIDAFKYRKLNYFKGLSCRCCINENLYKQQMDLLEEDKDDEYLTWANVLINANYPLFIKFFVPLFKEFPIVMVCNKNCDLEKMKSEGFNIVKDFRIGPNALVNDYLLPEEIFKWAKENKIKDHLFLLAASSVSNLICYKLFSDDELDKNFYIDIGSSLNPYMNMRLDREYLEVYWNKRPGQLKQCIW